MAEDPELCRQIQSRLQDLGLLPSNGVDGKYGPQTKNAFAQFKKATNQGDPDKLGPGSAKILIELKELPGGGGLLSKAQAEGIYGRSIQTHQLKDLNDCLNRFQINTPARMRHFLSQTAHEKVSNGQVVNNEPEPSRTAGKSNEQKTWFDWTEAILVPVVLAIVGIGFTAAQFVITSNKQDADSADKARETKEQVLTDYGKAIAELVTKDKLGQESSDESVKNIARGQTLIALRRLDMQKVMES